MGGSGLTLPDEISGRWVTTAVAYAQSRGYTFTSDCLNDLTSFLGNGALQSLAVANEVPSNSHHDDVRRLVGYMIEELDRTAPGDKELHEWTLSAARWRFCPLFPFC